MEIDLRFKCVLLAAGLDLDFAEAERGPCPVKRVPPN